MLDRLTLLIFRVPDYEYLDIHGNLRTDEYKRYIYKDMYEIEKATVFCKPHKYSEARNVGISFCRVDLNPKYFESFEHLWAYLCLIFNAPDLKPEEFIVSRIDLAVDIEDFPIINLLSMLHIKRIRPDSFSFYKGTIYAGSNPKIRIYDKVKEIKARLKKEKEVIEYEKGLVEADKSYTRFEIEKRPEKMKFTDVLENYVSLASDFDRLEIFGFNENEMSGVMQFAYHLINRKSRKELEKYKDQKIIDEIKKRFVASVTKWFETPEEPF